MGTANQMFAQNKIDEAVSLSLEIIRTCPGAAEPYQLLSEVLHEKGFQEHGYKMGLFAAHLDSSTPAERWIALADDSTRILGETEEVTKLRIACYRNAYNKTHDGQSWKFRSSADLSFLKNVCLSANSTHHLFLKFPAQKKLYKMEDRRLVLFFKTLERCTSSLQNVASLFSRRARI